MFGRFAQDMCLGFVGFLPWEKNTNTGKIRRTGSRVRFLFAVIFHGKLKVISLLVVPTL